MLINLCVMLSVIFVCDLCVYVVVELMNVAKRSRFFRRVVAFKVVDAIININVLCVMCEMCGVLCGVVDVVIMLCVCLFFFVCLFVCSFAFRARVFFF